MQCNSIVCGHSYPCIHASMHPSMHPSLSLSLSLSLHLSLCVCLFLPHLYWQATARNLVVYLYAVQHLLESSIACNTIIRAIQSINWLFNSTHASVVHDNVCDLMFATACAITSMARSMSCSVVYLSTRVLFVRLEQHTNVLLACCTCQSKVARCSVPLQNPSPSLPACC
jgi:hypothetical protein